MTDQITTVIDVRLFPRPLRHPIVFSLFDQLTPERGLELVSDHDPRPLRYLFDVKRPGSFCWDYLESGPATWRVSIRKALQVPDCEAALG
ncbi:DUF2249 domain-containing protein [Rhodopseudomonas sp. P1]|uniref:DUF2249 domain-containing protein n=1 Tax=Rhodopseudomonas sp. P1 TaxID=3434357 RepID=UPI0031FC1814